MLQTIFDVIWMELRESSTSKYNGPSDPEALRDEIARRVLDHYKGDGFSAKDITKQVLKSFDIGAEALGAANAGK